MDAGDLRDAVAIACGWARAGGVVLLSPAAPSFGRFADYRERARAFAEAAAECGTLSVGRSARPRRPGPVFALV